jgi:hypothetical protein
MLRRVLRNRPVMFSFGQTNIWPTSPDDRVPTRNRDSVELFRRELAPEASTGADEDDDQAERGRLMLMIWRMRDAHQPQALRRLERDERRAQADINREHAADPDDRTEYV